MGTEVKLKVMNHTVTRIMQIFNGCLALCLLLMCLGCSAIGSRVTGGGMVFSGVRADSAMLFESKDIDPDSRENPALILVDYPFSFVGDILFLPYDVYCDSTASSGNLD
jgi:uncharacterized protein YceK